MKTEFEEKQIVEEIGLIIEKIGGQPLLSRIISLLLIRVPDGITFDEIVAFLNASKSSVSTALKFLQQIKQITYYTMPGDRKRYFKLYYSEFWLADIEKKIQEVDSIILIIEKLKFFKIGEDFKLENELNNNIELLQRLQKVSLDEINKFKKEIHTV